MMHHTDLTSNPISLALYAAAKKCGLNETQLDALCLQLYHDIQGIFQQRHEAITDGLLGGKEATKKGIEIEIKQYLNDNLNTTINAKKTSSESDTSSQNTPTEINDDLIRLLSESITAFYNEQIDQLTREADIVNVISELTELLEKAINHTIGHNRNIIEAANTWTNINTRIQQTRLSLQQKSQVAWVLSDIYEQLTAKIDQENTICIGAAEKPDLLIGKFNDGKFKVTMPKPPITSLTISGGGAKGLVCLALYDYLEENNLLRQIQLVGGASAGAIFASLLAIGVNKKTLKKLMLEEKITDFIDFITFIKRDSGDNLQDFFKRTIRDAFAEKLPKVVTKESNREIYEKLNTKLTKLADNPDNKFQHPEQEGFTFLDLQDLKNILPPEEAVKIKDLHIAITRTRGGEGTLIQCSAEHTPNVPLDVALRISPAHPLMIKPYVDTKGYFGNLDDTYADGGIACNVPRHFLPNDTLSITFATDKEYNDAQRKLHEPLEDPSVQTRFFIGIMNLIKPYFIGGNFIRSDIETYKNIHAASHNNIIINTGDISTLDIDASEETKLAALEKGKKTIELYFKNHESEIAINFYDDALATVLALSDMQRKAVSEKINSIGGEQHSEIRVAIAIVEELNLDVLIKKSIIDINAHELLTEDNLQAFSVGYFQIQDALLSKKLPNFETYMAIIDERLDRETNRRFSTTKAQGLIVNKKNSVVHVKNTSYPRPSIINMFPQPPAPVPAPNGAETKSSSVESSGSNESVSIPSPGSMRGYVSLSSMSSITLPALIDKLRTERDTLLDKHETSVRLDQGDKDIIEAIIQLATTAATQVQNDESDEDPDPNNPQNSPDYPAILDQCNAFLNRNRIKKICGIVLAIAGIALIGLSIAAVFASHGCSTPLSIYGIKIGVDIIIAGCISAGILSMLTTSVGIRNILHGFFRPTLENNVKNIKKVAVNSIPHNPRPVH